MHKLRYLVLLCLIFIITGCGRGYWMALTKGQSGIDLSKKSIVLLSVKVANQNKPSRQLDLWGVLLCPQGETCSRYRPYTHWVEYPYRSEKDSFNEYLLSLELESGTYTLKWLGTRYEIPLLLVAGGLTNLGLKIDIKPNTISYVGHIDVVLRAKKGDEEERAGLLPLIDAAIIGYSTGTFDVVIEDKYEEDMKLFISEYPVLGKVKVEKSMLPQWVRPENRKSQ